MSIPFCRSIVTACRRGIVYLVIIISCLLISRISYSQNEEIQFENLSVEDGLEQEYVLCILKDSKGFMWLGTEDGLNRYDGKEFKVYKHNPADSNSLSINHVQAIYEDKNGNLWIGTYGGGLDKYEPATEKLLTTDMIRSEIVSAAILFCQYMKINQDFYGLGLKTEVLIYLIE